MVLIRDFYMTGADRGDARVARRAAEQILVAGRNYV
jgi:hypothetical protein